MLIRSSPRVSAPLLLTLILCVAPAYSASPRQETYGVTLREKVLRYYAKKVVMPDFPAESKKRGAKGVAVSKLEVDGNGDVLQVEVLQAPDDLIGKAVAEAIKQWKFKPLIIRGRPVSIEGKLTFYYIIDHSGARVGNPRQVP